MLSFIHLSDIHFHKNSGDIYDVDKDLRNELIRDISQNYTKIVAKTDCILVCGDIAFSGKKEEYDIATEFLKELCGLVKLEETEVFCVPGNHDVDQSVPTDEVCVKDLQDGLEKEENQAALDARLAKIMRGSSSKDMLAKPLENYIEHFASQFSYYTENLHEEKLLKWSRDFFLDTGYTLRLFGINSTLISNADDHAIGRTTQRPMRVSSLQIPGWENGVVYLTLCHHPTEHWNDPGGELEKLMDARVALQLYGHKHLQEIIHKEKTLIVGSGATHPSRLEPGWLPRYNWLTLEVVHDGESNALKITVYPRVYREGRFEADKGTDKEFGYKKYYVPLERPVSASVRKKTSTKKASEKKISYAQRQRRFVYNFMNLSFLDRNQLLDQFGLIGEEDDGKRHSELIPDILARAEKSGCSEQLFTAAEKRLL